MFNKASFLMILQSVVVLLSIISNGASGFGLIPPPTRSISTSSTQLMMGMRRGKGGNLKRALDETAGTSKNNDIKKINQGRGQEITGVTMPENMKIKGWAFGEDQTIAAANVNGKYYAVDGRCPRCAFDLYKGKLLVDKDVWGKDPCVACPTCSTTYSFRTGKFGPEYKQTGLAGFVNTWAKTATINNASQDVAAFIITKDEETGRVFCKERL
jgi:nitrite reductase/ring-hydroxylating ferredoxin subunit